MFVCFLFVCSFFCLSVLLFVCFLFVCSFVCLFLLFVCSFVCLFFCLFVLLFVCSFVCYFVCLFVLLFVCLFVLLFVCYFVCLFVLLFVLLFVCSFVCLFVCFVCLFVLLFVCLFFCLFVLLFVCLFVCLFAEVGTWLLLRLTKADKAKLLTLFGTGRRYCVSRESNRVLLWWCWSRAEDPGGGFCLAWDVNPILALKSQTQDYVAEEEDLIHDFCGSHGVMLSPALRAGGVYWNTQRHIVVLQTAGAGRVT